MNNKYKYVVLAVICLCGMSGMYCQYQMSPIADEIINTYSLTQVQYSMLFTAPMAPAIFISLICGLIVDKIGAKKVIFLSLVLAAAGLWGRVFVHEYLLLYICMLCPGFAVTFINSTNPKLLGEWFSSEQTGVAVGVYTGMVGIGAAIATGTTAMLPSIKTAYLFAAVFSSITALIWLIFMKENRLESTENDKTILGIASLKKVINNKNIILASVCIMCAYGCLMVMSTFLPIVLQEKGLGQESAGTAASLVSIGQTIGCFTVPGIVKKIGKFRISVFGFALVGAVLTVLVSVVSPGMILNGILFLVGYSVGGICPLFMALPIKIAEIGIARAGTAVGLITTFQLFGAVVIPSYVVSPIAGGNMSLLIVLGGAICAIVCLLVFFMSKEIDGE